MGKGQQHFELRISDFEFNDQREKPDTVSDR